MARDHAPRGLSGFGRAFALGTAFNVVYVAVEATFGLLADSLALLGDAGHNLGDVLALLLAWGAMALARRPATDRRTYGFRRATILASLLSAVMLLVAVGVIAWEAVGRFWRPAAPEAGTMLVVAGIGVVVNVATAALFFRGRRKDLNVRGAFLHMAADAAVSLGVVGAAVAIALTGEAWIDPAVSLAIAAAIVVGTWGLLRESLNLSMDAVPRGIDLACVDRYLRGLPGVADLHDLHVWPMSTTETALTVHLVMPGAAADDDMLCRIAIELEDRFAIDHATIQVERQDLESRCRLLLSEGRRGPERAPHGRARPGSAGGGAP